MRSKPDPVDQPERTAHYDCAIALLKCYTILGYNTETVLLIFPFFQTNITVQMRPSGEQGIVKRSIVQVNNVRIKWKEY